MGLRANIAHIQEVLKDKLYDEVEGDYKYPEKEEKSNSREKMGYQFMNIILAQIYNLSKYLEAGEIHRNETEVYDLIQSQNLEETLNNWTEQIRSNARQIKIKIARKLKYIRQVIYNTDANKTIQLLTKDQTLQREIEHE
jgi:ElaB/YqjD/DUF883 family membrane-anchored ribosome-binding protein